MVIFWQFDFVCEKYTFGQQKKPFHFFKKKARFLGTVKHMPSAHSEGKLHYLPPKISFAM